MKNFKWNNYFVGVMEVDKNYSNSVYCVNLFLRFKYKLWIFIEYINKDYSNLIK